MLPSGIIRQYHFAKCHGVTKPACDGQEQPVGKTDDRPSPSPSLWIGCPCREMVLLEMGAVLVLGWVLSLELQLF